MALEGQVSCALQFTDSLGNVESLSVGPKTFSPATLRWSKTIRQSIATSETTIQLGAVTSPEYLLIVNRDATNYVEVKVAASGAIFAKLKPGYACLVPLGSGAQAPVAIANTAACLVDVFVGSV